MTPRNLTAYEDFIYEQVSNQSHALTITLRDDSPTESLQNRRIRFEETIRHLLYRIARLCFKNRHKRFDLTIGSVVVIENGDKLGRLHAHLSLARPNEIQESQFEAIVLVTVSRCRSLGQHRMIKRITDSHGWASYMAKEGPEAFVPQCTQRAKY
jgi:hypothetical protein